MTSKEFIDNILITRGRFACEGYCELHHILPKCLGGGDEEENLIDLYAREHYEVHRLLALENPDNLKLASAWWLIANAKSKGQERVSITAEEYEEVKVHLAKILSIANSGENNPMYNKNAYENKTQEEMIIIKEKKQNTWANKSNEDREEHSMNVRLGAKNRRQVMCIETKEVYPSIRYAEKVSGAHRDDISECCKGLREVDYKLKYH